MIFGFPFGVPFGRHSAPEMFTYGKCTLIHGQAYLLEWSVATDCDGYYRAAVDAAKIGRPIYCVAGVVQQMIIQIPDGARTVSICPQGQFADNAVRIQDQIDAFFADGLHFIDRAQVNIVATVKVLYEKTAQLSSMDVGGFKRFTNVAPVDGRKTWGKLDVQLVTSGGVHTLTLFVNGRDMWRGSRTGDGSIDIFGGGYQGKVGTVTLTYTGDIALTDGVAVLLKWPDHYNIYLKSTAFVGGDFPRTVTATIPDDGFSNTFVFKSFVQAGGGKYIVVHEVGDDGNESTGIQLGGLLLTTYDTPAAPTGLAYVSGGGTNTVIHWTASTTSGASYNIYDSLATGILNATDIQGTHVSGSGTLTQTLANIGSYTGLRYVLVRSLKTGVEESNLTLLILEYASGTYIALRPPVPYGGNHFSTSGRTLTVPVSLYLDPSNATPATVELYVYLSTGSPNYASATATASVPTNPGGLSVLSLSIAGTVGANGVYLYELRSKTAGGTNSGNVNTYGPVELTNTAMADPVFVVDGV